MGLFSTKKAVSTVVEIVKDLRTGVEQMTGGILVGPAATVGAPAGVTTSLGDYSTMTQSITAEKFQAGLTGGETAELLRQQNLAYQAAGASAAATSAKIADLATSALSVQTGVPDWQRYIVPIGVLVALVMIFRRR